MTAGRKGTVLKGRSKKFLEMLFWLRLGGQGGASQVKIEGKSGPASAQISVAEEQWQGGQWCERSQREAGSFKL